MAELERVAKSFDDIGAICNNALFAIAHAHCGIFRRADPCHIRSAFVIV